MHTSESVTQYNSVENADESRLITWMDAPWLIFSFLQSWFFLRMGQNSWQKCNCLLCLSHQSGKRVSEEEKDHLLSSSIWAYTAILSKGATESAKDQTTGCLEQELRHPEKRRVHTQTLKWYFRKNFSRDPAGTTVCCNAAFPFLKIFILYFFHYLISHMLFLFYFTPLADEIYLNIFKHNIHTRFIVASAFLRSHVF